MRKCPSVRGNVGVDDQDSHLGRHHHEGVVPRPAPGRGESGGHLGGRRGVHLGSGGAAAAAGAVRGGGLLSHRPAAAGLDWPRTADPAHCGHREGEEPGLGLGAGSRAGDPGLRRHPAGGGVGEQGAGRPQLQARLRLPPPAGCIWTRPERRWGEPWGPATPSPRPPKIIRSCWTRLWLSCRSPPASRTMSGAWRCWYVRTRQVPATVS